MAGNFWIGWVTFGFSRRTLLHRVSYYRTSYWVIRIDFPVSYSTRHMKSVWMQHESTKLKDAKFLWCGRYHQRLVPSPFKFTEPELNCNVIGRNITTTVNTASLNNLQLIYPKNALPSSGIETKAFILRPFSLPTELRMELYIKHPQNWEVLWVKTAYRKVLFNDDVSSAVVES
jgi:hypothetical protein